MLPTLAWFHENHPVGAVLFVVGAVGDYQRFAADITERCVGVVAAKPHHAAAAARIEN
jgi:hypothetical protein